MAGMDSFGVRLTTNNFTTFEDFGVGSAINDSSYTFTIATDASNPAVYQGISQLTARIVHYDVDGTAGTGTRSGFENVSLNGAVVTAVPEPSTVVLVLAALGPILMLRRRRHLHQ